MVETHYAGSFLPLRGVECLAALDSTLRPSFRHPRWPRSVRQIHHWAAFVFVAGSAYMSRVFTGAFRKPRELNLRSLLSCSSSRCRGFHGYSLDDPFRATVYASSAGMVRYPADRHLDPFPAVRRRVPRQPQIVGRPRRHILSAGDSWRSSPCTSC